MKNFPALLGLATAFLVSAASAQSNIVASWDFEPDPLPSILTSPTFPASGSFAADNGGTGSLIASHASNNTTWSSPSGNGSTNSLSANNWTIGDYFQFQFSTVALSNIAITWSQTRFSSGPSDFSLQYSTNGALFTVFTNYTVGVATWSSESNNLSSIFAADLASIVAIDNQPDVYLRLVAESAPTATSGSTRIDDVTITAVPEPGTFSMLALAAVGVAAHVIRRRRR